MSRARKASQPPPADVEVVDPVTPRIPHPASLDEERNALRVLPTFNALIEDSAEEEEEEEEFKPQPKTKLIKKAKDVDPDADDAEQVKQRMVQRFSPIDWTALSKINRMWTLPEGPAVYELSMMPTKLFSMFTWALTFSSSQEPKISFRRTSIVETLNKLQRLGEKFSAKAFICRVARWAITSKLTPPKRFLFCPQCESRTKMINDLLIKTPLHLSKEELCDQLCEEEGAYNRLKIKESRLYAARIHLQHAHEKHRYPKLAVQLMNPIGVLKQVKSDFSKFTSIDLLPEERVGSTITERLEGFIATFEGLIEEMKHCQCQEMMTTAYNVPHRMRLYFSSLVPIIRHMYENF